MIPRKKTGKIIKDANEEMSIELQCMNVVCKFCVCLPNVATHHVIIEFCLPLSPVKWGVGWGWEVIKKGGMFAC